MQDLKYLKYFGNYIAEQEMPQVDEEGNVIPVPKEDVYSFLFIDQGDTGDYKYPDGSSSRSYNSFEISKGDLEDWLESNVSKTIDDTLTDNEIEVRRNSIFDFISGINSNLSPENKKFVQSFRNNVRPRPTPLKDATKEKYEYRRWFVVE